MACALGELEKAAEVEMAATSSLVNPSHVGKKLVTLADCDNFEHPVALYAGRTAFDEVGVMKYPQWVRARVGTSMDFRVHRTRQT
jgi:hypothetical protein